MMANAQAHGDRGSFAQSHVAPCYELYYASLFFIYL